MPLGFQKDAFQNNAFQVPITYSQAVAATPSLLATLAHGLAFQRALTAVAATTASVSQLYRWLRTVSTTSTTTAHNLGAAPTLIDTYLECLTAELGYAVGDHVYLTVQDSPDLWVALASTNATNVYITTGSNSPSIPRRDVPGNFGTIVLARWKLVAVPYKLN